MILNGWYPVVDKENNVYIRKHGSILQTIRVRRLDPDMKFFLSDEGVKWELGKVCSSVATVELMEKLYAVSQPK